MMLANLLDYLDRIDHPESLSDAAEKVASDFNERASRLESASPDDFAAVVFDGHRYKRSFPVQTEDDIRMSREALDKSASELPDEIVKVARYHIELAARERLGESFYGDEALAEPQATNLVYTGFIDRRSFESKQAEMSKEAASGECLAGTEYLLSSANDVRIAERLLDGRSFGFSGEAEYEACRQLIKKAEELGVELTSKQVLRYRRDTLPAKFASQVELRRDLTANEAVKTYYDQLVKEAAQMGPVRTAKALHILDQLAGFAPLEGEKIAANRLGKGAPSAYEVVFPLEEEPVSRRHLDKVAALFGEAFAEEYEKEGAVALERLSPTERRMISTIQ